MEPTRHVSVLQEEILSFLGPTTGAAQEILLDCTLGGGGHSLVLLEKYREMRLVGLDVDAKALERAELRLAPVFDRVYLMRGNFSQVEQLLNEHQVEIATKLQLDQEEPLLFCSILADLGFSSDQIEDPTRGFSFKFDSPLDMRLDLSAVLTASTVVNEYSLEELRRVFRAGGLGAESARLARAIIANRPFSSTRQLADLCLKVFPPYRNRKSEGLAKNPATVPFQAIRIEVNDELNVLTRFLQTAVSLLRSKGRLAVISFHSLEDQLVASQMRAWSRSDTPRDLPVARESATGELLTKKAVTPGEGELANNPRARSARLRVFEKS